jgi:hypothetical protein
MTSSELLDAFILRFPDKKDTTGDLRFVLTNADLAKFAKSTPLPTDNETCYANVLRYIESEKDTPTVDADVSETPVSSDEQNAPEAPETPKASKSSDLSDSQEKHNEKEVQQ